MVCELQHRVLFAVRTYSIIHNYTCICPWPQCIWRSSHIKSPLLAMKRFDSRVSVICQLLLICGHVVITTCWVDLSFSLPFNPAVKRKGRQHEASNSVRNDEGRLLLQYTMCLHDFARLLSIWKMCIHLVCTCILTACVPWHCVTHTYTIRRLLSPMIPARGSIALYDFLGLIAIRYVTR